MTEKDKYIQGKILELSPGISRLLLFFGAITFLLLSLLDFFVTPENFKKFLLYRLAVSASLMAFYFIINLKQNRLYQSTIIIAGVLITASAIELMILSFGGHQSTYYAGMIIGLIFIFGFVPISAKATLLLAVAAYSIYILPILILDHITNVKVFINNNIFLLAAIIIGLVWRSANYRLLTRNLALEYDLSRDKKQLEVYSMQLRGMVEDRTKELMKSEQWHKSLVDNATDGIVVLDPNGIIVNINDRACDMHGFSREALVGGHIRILEDDARQEESNDRMKRLIAGESLVFESVHHKKDGTPLYLEISSKAIRIGEEVFIQSFYRDISEKKKLQEYLFQSQKMESIGVLAGGIAHDFNNILTAILGHSEIIRRTELEDKASRSLNVIEEASRRAGRMISKLLGFARKSNYEIVPVNLNDVIYDTVKLLERVIDKKINLTIELDNTIPLILGDVSQMEQVIMNLIVNARDAMPDGGRIVIRTSVKDVVKGMPDVPPYVPPGEYVIMNVIDTGTGIPREVVNKIFEPFFTTKERGKGTGLGLSMVYGVIKEHKGFISVQSEINKGSTFTIYIPASRSAEVTELKKEAPSVSGNETILVVDDESDILQAIQDALSTHGYRVYAFSDPNSALAIFEKLSGEIDLVITDIVMPRINGKELIGQMKAVSPDVKILAISGYTKYIAPKHEIGEINEFLQKPFESYYLLSVVRRILDTRPRHLMRN